MAFPSYFPHDVQRLFAVSSALLIVLSVTLQQQRFYLPKAFFISCLVVFASQLFISALYKPAAPQAWFLHLLLYLGAALLFVSGINIPRNKLKSWLHIYLLLSSLWVLIGLYVWLDGTDGNDLKIGVITVAILPYLKLAGPFQQGNILATLVGFSWLISHWFALNSSKHIYRFSILFFTIALLSTLSRGAWIAYCICLIMLLLTTNKFSYWLRKFLPYWLSGAFLGYICFELRTTPYVQHYDLSLVVINSATSPKTERLLIWATSFSEFLTSPWFGVGWGQFPDQFWYAAPAALQFMQDSLGLNNLQLYNTVFNAHNIFLHLAAEAGVFALILFFWGCWILAKHTGSLLLKPDSIRLPFALSVIGFLLHSQIGIIYSEPLVLLIAALFSGIALTPWLRHKSWNLKPTKAAKIILIASVSVVVLWSSQSISQWFMSESIYRQIKVENKESIKRLDEVMHLPRVRAIPLTSLAYTVALYKQHSEVLKPVIPFLETSLPEIPSLSAHQVLFYAHMYAANYERACQIGRKIMGMHFTGEKNTATYQLICNGEKPVNYHFGLVD
ncbi:O-Antigen ligase [Mariprofundus micogutta]|uniref:O-Antigen ligase n=2 Tax=Mariprofundus micogutta TaxID=1921010 RepID=A0A1L8CQT4_9PROT|nr:O-Antigen ligase [Mariprofundus micogutta]